MTSNKIHYTLASNDQHLKQILELQSINLPANIDEDTFKSQGFVTVQHDLELLKKMNTDQAHAIALDGDKVIGYALSMTTRFSKHLPVLVPMFEMISQLNYRDKAMDEYKYFVMGQVCIAKKYRSTGVFSGLYQQLRKAYSQDYDFIITEIDERNIRSIAAHKKVGFNTLHQYRSDSGVEWVLVIWDWS